MSFSPSASEAAREPTPGALRDAIIASTIATVAPEETPLVEALYGLDDETALKRLTTRPGRGEPLGFGVGAAGVLLMPALWIAVDEVVRRVVDAGTDRAGKSKLWHRKALSRRRNPEPTRVPSITPEQLKTIEQCVRDAAQQAHLSSDRSERIADGVVRRLALMQSSAEQPPQRAGGGA